MSMGGRRRGPGGFGHRPGGPRGFGHGPGGFGRGPRGFGRGPRGFGPPPPPPPRRGFWGWGRPRGCLGCGLYLLAFLAAIGGIIAALIFLL